jgi:hypothetical protein
VIGRAKFIGNQTRNHDYVAVWECPWDERMEAARELLRIKGSVWVGPKGLDVVITGDGFLVPTLGVAELITGSHNL